MLDAPRPRVPEPSDPVWFSYRAVNLGITPAGL